MVCSRLGDGCVGLWLSTYIELTEQAMDDAARGELWLWGSTLVLVVAPALLLPIGVTLVRRPIRVPSSHCHR